jgi:hypothetical protein
MSNGSCRASSTSCRAVPQIAGPLRVVVPSGPCLYGLRVWASAQGTACRLVFVSCRPTAHQTDNISFSLIFSLNTEIFYHCHQLFIIFTNITINSTYIQVITTPTVHVHRTDRWNGPCLCRATCLGGSPDTAWSLGSGRLGPGIHRDVPCSGQAKSLGHGPSHGPGHRAMGHMAMYNH